MSEYNDSREAFVDGLRADMPPAAGEDALQRVKMQALGSRRASVESPLRQRSWRMAGGLAAVAAVIAVAALALAPGQQTAAFARDRAAEALLFQTPGRVLHIEATYTERWNGKESKDSSDLDQRWSIWADADGRGVREEFTDRRDGSLDELRVRTNDRLAVFISDEGGKPRLFEQDMSNQPVTTALDDMVGYMRSRIVDGSAKVTGATQIDGEKYWVVEWKAEEGDIAITVTMRTSDYRIKTWAQDVTNKDGSGGTQEERVTFETVEQLEPGSLPDGFFSRNAVIDAATPGTPLEKR